VNLSRQEWHRVDVVDRQTRSRMMSGIKGSNTKPEVSLRKALHKRGFRFRLHDRRLAGRPDLVLARYRAAIFVHGCFWHRHHGCRFASSPSTNSEFWLRKFASNVKRDLRDTRELLSTGWRVAIVWECGLKSVAVEPTVELLAKWIPGQKAQLELPAPETVDRKRTRTLGALGVD
jgi:DNA mismatch endonuclease (patch repair protein)